MASTAVLASRGAYTPPRDAEEMYARDGAFIRGMVRKCLGPAASAQDVEDAMSDIVEKLVKRDVVHMYDPAHPSHATWHTFLGRQVELYGRWKRDQVGNRQRREVHAPAEDDGTWLEAVTGQVWDDYPSLSDSEFVQKLRDLLASPRGDWSGPVSLLALFEVMVRQAKTGEPVTRSVIQAEFGLTPAASRTALARLRGTLRQFLVPRKVDIAGIKLTPEQALAAADALEESRGNRVSPALEVIGSPLAGLSTRQYIKLGRDELRSYPECKVAKGTRHANHSSQTKVALVHLLRRTAGPAPEPVPAPEPEEVPEAEELLEAKLWHFQGMTPDLMDEILGLAKIAYAGHG